MSVERHTDATRAKMRAAWERRRERMPAFWDHVDRSGDCWLWTAALTGAGYGLTSRAGRKLLAHRVAYEELIGPIPAGLTLDHLCRIRRCVNPSHLEPVTMRENTLRGVGPVAMNAQRTTCRNGHPFDIERHGRRECRTCRNATARVRNAAYRARRRAYLAEVES